MVKNIHAVELGRLGGQARAKNLSPEKRKEIARKASLSRLNKKTSLTAKKVLDKPDSEALS